MPSSDSRHSTPSVRRQALTASNGTGAPASPRQGWRGKGATRGLPFGNTWPPTSRQTEHTSMPIAGPARRSGRLCPPGRLGRDQQVVSNDDNCDKVVS